MFETAGFQQYGDHLWPLVGILEKIAVGVLGVPQLVPRPLSQDPLLTAKGPILGAQRTLLAAQDQ